MARKQLTTWQAACLITGYSVGSGIMALPYLMSRAGVVPGALIIVVSFVLSYWSNCLACMDMIPEQFKLGHVLCWLIATVPSILLVLFVSGSFLDNMKVASGIVAIIIAVALPFVFHRAMRERGGKLALMPRWMASAPVLVVLTIAFVLMAVGSMI